jgi:hypothetical protein
MPAELSSMVNGLAGMLLLVGAPTWLIASYFFMVWDSRKEGSASKDDGQMGIKLVALFLLIVGIGIASGGATSLLHYLLSGTKTGTPMLKGSIASIIAGGAAVFGVSVMLLPRTNAKQYPKATRYAAGYLAGIAGAMALWSFNEVLGGLINSVPWVANSGSFARLVVFAAIAVVALGKLGGLSGWSAPARPAFPQGGGMQGGGMQGGGQQGYGGYPPQGGGYPPQGGGYPPQGGGYPPQGGGYPPQGGGYPPQGGGYPPR